MKLLPVMLVPVTPELTRTPAYIDCALVIINVLPVTALFAEAHITAAPHPPAASQLVIVLFEIVLFGALGSVAIPN